MSAKKIDRQPTHASAEYVRARDTLADAEVALSEQTEKVAALRRALPQGAAMTNYTFTVASPGISGGAPERTTMTLAELAGDGRSLVVYHMMFGPDEKEPCPMCALFVDGMEGVAPHIKQKVNFAVIAKAGAPKLAEYAAKRGWKRVRILSSGESAFNTDMLVEKPAGAPGDFDQLPAVSVFRKGEDGKVYHVYTQYPHMRQPDRMERGMDALSPFWNLLDLIPEGRGTEYARNDYVFE
jgi:predicted dithiol-disulfide oxidoreductase (DUF899 family)